MRSGQKFRSSLFKGLWYPKATPLVALRRARNPHRTLFFAKLFSRVLLLTEKKAGYGQIKTKNHICKGNHPFAAGSLPPMRRRGALHVRRTLHAARRFMFRTAERFIRRVPLRSAPGFAFFLLPKPPCEAKNPHKNHQKVTTLLLYAPYREPPSPGPPSPTLRLTRGTPLPRFARHGLPIALDPFPIVHCPLLNLPFCEKVLYNRRAV